MVQVLLALSSTGSVLAVVLDIFSRLVVGWPMDAHRDEVLVDQAARMARRHPELGLVHHSDRGSPFPAERRLDKRSLSI